MNAQFDKFAKDIPPPGFSEDDHPGGALHDYPGSQGAAGAAKADDAAAVQTAAATKTAASALDSGHTEPGVLSTQAGKFAPHTPICKVETSSSPFPLPPTKLAGCNAFLIAGGIHAGLHWWPNCI